MPEPPITYNNFHPLAHSAIELNFINIQSWSARGGNDGPDSGQFLPTHVCIIPGEGLFIWQRGSFWSGSISWYDNGAVWVHGNPPLPECADA